MDKFFLSNYDYALPHELIAQCPAQPRDSSRLFVLHRKSGHWEHRFFLDLPEYLDQNDLIVANNSQVFRARLKGRRPSTGGQVEVLLLKKVGERLWESLLKTSARPAPGFLFEIPLQKEHQAVLLGRVVGQVTDKVEANPPLWLIEFDRDPFKEEVGEVPLPPYIKPSLHNSVGYQTIYARPSCSGGSAAAPTAGLHFSEKVVEAIKKKGVQWSEVTLHVGLGTFLPVKTEDIRDHLMHEEFYDISTSTAQCVTQWKLASQQARVTAVGTTTLRVLESAWNGSLREGCRKTSLFIYPGSGHSFQVVDRLLTNFHTPKSSLLMLVCAFAGRELALEAYAEAVREKYRFFSYGDAMLICD